MADVKVTIDAVITDMDGSTVMGPVKIVGSMSKSGVGVGGGPILPEEPDKPWGGSDEPFPTPPIHLPKPPAGFPNPPADGLAKNPPPGGGWGYSLEFGWGYFPMGGPVPGPK